MIERSLHGMQERATSWAWQAVTGSIHGGWEKRGLSREKPVTSPGMIQKKPKYLCRPDMEQKVSDSMTGCGVRSQNSTDPIIRRMIAEHGFGDCSCVEIQLIGISLISLSGALIEQHLKNSFRSREPAGGSKKVSERQKTNWVSITMKPAHGMVGIVMYHLS